MEELWDFCEHLTDPPSDISCVVRADSALALSSCSKSMCEVNDHEQLGPRASLMVLTF